MTEYGYALSSEEHPPADLVRNAARAEEAGFTFACISDHYHPWVNAQGHSPFVWSVLGGIAATTQRLSVGVGVTCPIIRIHPAVLAQAAATTSSLFGGRFFLGVGTGELLNEHILGDRWPPADVRLEMLEEAVAVMRLLWEGGTKDHHGKHYTVENAHVYDLPEGDLPVVVSAFGPKAMEVAARIGDGYWGTSPQAELVEQYQKQGGTGPRYAQASLCWAPDVATARRTVFEQWPNGGVSGQASQDLPTPSHFEQVASVLTEEQVVGSTPCGPDPEQVVESVKQYVDAGYDHVYFHQIGPDQEGFFRFWENELRPRLS